MKKMISDISKTQNYITPFPHVVKPIYEYDIRKANITMLRKAGAIDDVQYSYYARLPKEDREREIGLMIRNDKKVYHIIQKGIEEAKEELIRECMIGWEDVVRISNDALFLTKPAGSSFTTEYTCEDGFTTFVRKNIYTSMMKLGPLVVFYNDKESDVRVIGIKDEQLALHDGYMLSFIIQIIECMNRAPIGQTVRIFTDTYNKFLRLELPIEFYREFNAASMYAIYKRNGERFLVSSSKELAIHYLDIGYNAYILRELYSILVGYIQFR